MKKKLSVIVVHYSESQYVIKYCIYRLFPVFYHHLYSYYDSVLGYSFTMGRYDSMEEYAKTLTIEKINEINEKGEQSCRDYFKSKENWEKRNVPYYSKKIQ